MLCQVRSGQVRSCWIEFYSTKKKIFLAFWPFCSCEPLVLAPLAVAPLAVALLAVAPLAVELLHQLILRRSCSHLSSNSNHLSWNSAKKLLIVLQWPSEYRTWRYSNHLKARPSGFQMVISWTLFVSVFQMVKRWPTIWKPNNLSGFQMIGHLFTIWNTDRTFFTTSLDRFVINKIFLWPFINTTV